MPQLARSQMARRCHLPGVSPSRSPPAGDGFCRGGSDSATVVGGRASPRGDAGAAGAVAGAAAAALAAASMLLVAASAAAPAPAAIPMPAK